MEKRNQQIKWLLYTVLCGVADTLSDWDYLIVQDYINGPSLADTWSTYSIWQKICAAFISVDGSRTLAFSHQDINPRNIIVGEEDGRLWRLGMIRVLSTLVRVRCDATAVGE
ncbi:hypothetical protein GYMLUDRAFT_58385 [Collybiopsis luxurians FD-317 M1]|uniref:Unplaced genomic scaffold GYMLUscaffold_20, whole genome shotgun sequence n=1 Tax=Collybiopsis luxurians FD-317 M1 TaxID=944289 RepID=A0A0D0CS99_9AGAR|nr:hypothetical protein GYMLUDRAFT_58385 [Collybiopsis luxurians FD-317 M1]